MRHLDTALQIAHVYLKIIDGETLCVHGGLSPDIRTLDQIRIVSRAQEIPHEGAFCGMHSISSSHHYFLVHYPLRFNVVRSRRHRELGGQSSRGWLAFRRECYTRSECLSRFWRRKRSILPVVQSRQLTYIDCKSSSACARRL